MGQLRTLSVVLVAVLLGAGIAGAALTVETSPGSNTSPTGTVSWSQNEPFPGFGSASMDFSGQFGARLGDRHLYRSTEDPSVAGPVHASTVAYYTFQAASSEYLNGAQAGDDNWLYICSKVDDVLVYNGWVKMDLSPTAATPVLYVHDPASPTTLITLPEAVAAATPSPRDIQIKSVDFENGIIELHNFGAGDQSLAGWRFCTHDENQVRRYSGSSGLNGVTMEAGTSLFIHFNNDAPVVDADHINRSSTGGSWATPLDAGAYGLGLYFQTPFGTGANIADHVQWSLGGVDDASADERSDEAQSGGVWTNQSQWVATSGATTKIILTDGANGALHGPADYLVLPDFGITGIVRNSPSEVVLTWPVVNNLAVSVEKNTTLEPGTWSCGVPTMGAGTTLSGQGDGTAFYRLSVPLP